MQAVELILKDPLRLEETGRRVAVLVFDRLELGLQLPISLVEKSIEGRKKGV